MKSKYAHDSPEMKAFRSDPANFDPDLHAIGVRQCEVNQKNVNGINFTTVFVSPMQRALQTAIHMFKSHPNKGSLKVIVLPIVREVLETSNDIALDFDELIRKYAPG